MACALRGRVALRLSPCPPSAILSRPENTAAAPFRQGTDIVRVCARDYAARRGANVNCAMRRLRVDNACPLGGVAGGATLTAGVRGVHRGFVASRHDHPRVAGRLLNAAGNPVAGAKVCVAAQALPRRAVEHILATPTTGADGHFAAPIPPDPRAACGSPTGRQSAARFSASGASASARARGSLCARRAASKRRQAALVAHLPGPVAEHRLVRIEALAHRRWIPVTGGRTGAAGTYRGSYRFHATSGSRTYRFRALVPHQAGYPYAAGTSAVMRKRVSGVRKPRP